MRDTIVRSARAGETTQRTAERLLEIDDPIVRLPEHMRDLRDAAREAAELGDRNVLEEAVDRWRGRVERLGEGRPGAGPTPGATTVRSATQQIVTDLERARPEQIGRGVDRWVLERARHQERVIARTETVEAFRDVYRQSVEQQPHVAGLRFTLSSRHPKPDVCDVLAGQDLHGLGPGGYPTDQYPQTPHPTDLCTPVAIVDSAYQRRELARVRGEPEPPRPWESGRRETAAEWLARQPETRRNAILGPTRARVFAEAPERVVTAQGLIRPVHEVTGRPPPIRRLGPRVAARPLVARDRAAMVRRLPELPRMRGGSGSDVPDWTGPPFVIAPLSRRPFVPTRAGGPLRHLGIGRVRITPRAVGAIEDHLARTDPSQANDVMLDRLRMIAEGRLEPDPEDRLFATHELRELVRLRRLGVGSGPVAWEDWNNAHTAALEEYGVSSHRELYHPTARDYL